MSEELIKILTDQSKAIGRIEGKLSELVGNGKPGKIQKFEDDIDALKSSRNYALGFGAGLIAIEGAYHFILHRMGIK